MLSSVRLLSGGAAQALVKRMQDAFAAQGGHAVRGTYGAVGAMRDKLLAGEPCDMVILSQALVDQLAADGHLLQATATPLGAVKTGVAVKSGQPQPRIGSAAELKAALLAAPGIYFPDPEKATAGIHFMKVLNTLGIANELGGRLRTYPNGATAMREMAAAAEADVIGCTQVTEILPAPGVQLVGLLPREFELATVYTAAVCTRAADPDGAATFIELLASEQAAPVRAECGFEPRRG